MQSMLNSLSDAALVFLLSMLPILEQSFAIPYGIAKLGMSEGSAFFWSTSGNIFVTILLLIGLDPVTQFLRKHVPGMKRLTDWLFERTRKKHSERLGQVGHIALFLFVAIPGPGSGAWTSALISYLFGVKKKNAFVWISLGLLVSGILMTFGTRGVIHAIEWVIGIRD